MDKSYNFLIPTLGGKTVRYYPDLAAYTGGAKPALLLSQLLYWSFNPAMQKYLSDHEGYFYVSSADMQEQTGLTDDEQRTARTQLINRGLIETTLKGKSPATLHYRVKIEQLSDYIETQLSVKQITGYPESSKLDLRNTGNSKETKKETREQDYPADPIYEACDDDGNPLKPVKKKKSRGIAAELTPIASAISEVTGLSLQINAARIYKEAAALAQDPRVSPELIRITYSKGGAWYRKDWRGKRGDRPKVNQIGETLFTFDDPEENTVKGDLYTR